MTVQMHRMRDGDVVVEDKTHGGVVVEAIDVPVWLEGEVVVVDLVEQGVVVVADEVNAVHKEVVDARGVLLELHKDGLSEGGGESGLGDVRNSCSEGIAGAVVPSHVVWDTVG